METRELQHQVADAVQAGAGLEEVEHDLLEPVQIEQERRDALWLYAWALVEARDEEALLPA